jgi:hypothetical protein
MLFDDVLRTDGLPARPGETRFQFLNRSATTYFVRVRELLEEWLSHIPHEPRHDLIGRLRADDLQHQAAFWELYLHEGYRRSGFSIEFHPQVAGVSARPDFRLGYGTSHFYLEAVSVGQHPARVAEEQRLAEVYRVLREMRIEGFTIGLQHYGLGPRPLATKRLRADLRAWLDALDPDVVVDQISKSESPTFANVPQLPWEDDGWVLVFNALPLKPTARGTPRRALGMMGPGRARAVDNVTGMQRVLYGKNGKYRKYGVLDAPLVVAIQSNTEYATEDYQVEQLLFGLSSARPNDPGLDPSDLFEEGFWLTRAGWRRGDCPQVVSIYGLAPWTIANAVPRLWSTLQPGVDQPTQPAWLSPVDVAETSRPAYEADLPAHFGIDEAWLRSRPLFDAE